MGTPWIFKITKGKIKKIMGIIRLRSGDTILRTDRHCKNGADEFIDFNISHSM
jgi:hypothetical protein